MSHDTKLIHVCLYAVYGITVSTGQNSIPLLSLELCLVLHHCQCWTKQPFSTQPGIVFSIASLSVLDKTALLYSAWNCVQYCITVSVGQNSLPLFSLELC